MTSSIRIPLQASAMLSWIVVAALLAACAGSGTKVSDDGANRKAAQTNTSLGRNYMQREQYEIALEKLKRAVAYDHTYAPAHTMLAILYETLGKNEMAGKEYRLAVRYDPEDGDVNNNYAVFLCNSGESGKAEKHFEAAFADPFYQTQEVAYANAGVCFLQNNDLDKAERFLRQSLEYDAEFPAALLPLANLSLRKGALLQARAFLQRYEAVSEESEESLYLGYRIEQNIGDSRTAGEYRDRLQRLYPKGPAVRAISDSDND